MHTYHYYVVSHTANTFYWPNSYFACAEDDDWRDLAMLARDGAPTPKAAPVVIQEPAKTSHGPIAGLTFLENRDHRFGLFRF